MISQMMYINIWRPSKKNFYYNSQNIHVTNEQGKLPCIMYARGLNNKPWGSTTYFCKWSLMGGARLHPFVYVSSKTALELQRQNWVVDHKALETLKY